MDYTKFESNVQNYTSAVKEKMLIVNGTAIAVDNKVEDVKTEISSLMNDVSALDSSFRSYVDDHDSAHFSLGKTIEDINSSISGIKTDISTLNTLIYDKIEEQAESATAYFTQIDSSISSVKADVVGIKDDISTLNAWKTSHESDYQALVNADVAINSSISAMKAKEAALDASVVSLISADTEINSSISAMKAKENALDASVVSLISSDSQINSSISAIKTTLGNNSDASTASTIYGMIASLRADFEAYELITATALADVSARLDAANIA